MDPGLACGSTSEQLNHYFEGGDPLVLVERLQSHLSSDVIKKMKEMATGQKISVRTRGVSGIAKIVMKASVGSDSSDNGVIRMEIDEPVTGMTLDALDEELCAAGYRYQAKWSRSREEYQLGTITVCLDKNAGYGYLVEFEKVITDPAQMVEAKREIEDLMTTLGVDELPQDRLERMFAYYNEHWPEYYGTEKVFVVE